MTTSLFDVTDTETIRGTINRVMYAENGRTVARITVAPESLKDAQGKRRPAVMTVLGSLVEPTVGQMYEFTGQVRFNDRFKSHEIQFDSYRTILPTDRDGIAAYLIDVAKWVGPSHAKALLDAFGSETLVTIKESPDKVAALAIPGLTAERIQEMQATLRQNEKLEAATIEVNNLLAGVLGPATTKKAIRKWGSDAATLIKGNPFQLTALHGVGFISADAIHKKIGGEPTDIRRHYAALLHVLQEAAAREGHTVLSTARAEMDANRLVGRLRPEVWSLTTPDEDGFTCAGPTVTLAELSGGEKYIAGKLASMLNPKCRCKSEAEHEDRIATFPIIDAEGLAEDQAAAVVAFQPSPVFLLVGAPGTGKTYTVARLVKSLDAAGLTVALAAPTGKAAKQMSLALADVCPRHARTIHSLLEPSVDEETGEFSFSRDEGNPLDADVIILDECSMVDVPLMRSFLRAVRESTRLLFVGDHYQLPSVGPGAVLRDLLAAGVPHYELRQIKRNAGLIVRACHAMKDGTVPEPAERLDLEAGANWRHWDCAEPESIKAAIDALVREKLPAAGVDRLWGWQLISPVNEAGPLSCDALNDLAKGVINPAEAPEKGLRFAVGDKVVRTKNGECKGHLGHSAAPSAAVSAEEAEYSVQSRRPDGDGQIRVVNGDVGVVRAVTAKEIEVHFRFPDRTAYLRRSEHHLRMAYCMTCHKMQGSEVDVVILPLHRSFARLPMVTREWIYTAFSRAKKFIVTVGDLDALAPMVARVGTHQRHTLLAGLLEQLRGFEI